jgi:hypothetical protein
VYSIVLLEHNNTGARMSRALLELGAASLADERVRRTHLQEEPASRDVTPDLCETIGLAHRHAYTL